MQRRFEADGRLGPWHPITDKDTQAAGRKDELPSWEKPKLPFDVAPLRQTYAPQRALKTGEYDSVLQNAMCFLISCNLPLQECVDLVTELLYSIGCTVDKKTWTVLRHAGNVTELGVEQKSDSSTSLIHITHKAGRIDLFQALVTDQNICTWLVTTLRISLLAE